MRSPRSPERAAGVLAIFLLAGCASSERRLPAPAHLSQTARDLLADRMLNHGNDMSDLLWAMARWQEHDHETLLAKEI